MASYLKGVAYTRAFVLVSASDHLSPLTGAAASTVVNLSKAGGAMAAAAGAIAEISLGFYKVALTTVDTGTAGDLGFSITATGSDYTQFTDQVVDPTVASVGVSVVSPTFPTNFALLAIDANGRTKTLGGLTIDTALAGFAFQMTNSTTHAPQTGLSVTGTRALNGGAFGALANGISEIGNGWYTVNLAAADLNGATVALRFIAQGADDRDLTLIPGA